MSNFKIYSGNDIDLLKELFERVIKLEKIVGILPESTAQIGDNAATTIQIGDNAATTTQIGDKAITTSQIGDKAITTSHIGDKAITTAQIGDKAITTAQIGDKAITTAHIGDKAITTAHIGYKAITTSQIGDKAITTAHIGDKAITTAHIGDKAVTTAHIGDKAITTAHIGDKAVTTAHIGDKAVRYSHIQGVSQPALLGSVSGDSISEVQMHGSLVLDASGYLGINYGVLYQNEQVTALADKTVTMKHGVSSGEDIVVYTDPNFAVEVTKTGIYKISFGCTITSADVYLNLYKNITDIVVSKLFCAKTKPASRELFCSVKAQDIFRLVFNKTTEISDAFLTIQRIK